MSSTKSVHTNRVKLPDSASHDNGRGQIVIRVILAVLVMAKPAEIYGAAAAAGIGLILAHAVTTRKRVAA